MATRDAVDVEKAVISKLQTILSFRQSLNNILINSKLATQNPSPRFLIKHSMLQKVHAQYNIHFDQIRKNKTGAVAGGRLRWQLLHDRPQYTDCPTRNNSNINYFTNYICCLKLNIISFNTCKVILVYCDNI